MSHKKIIVITVGVLIVLLLVAGGLFKFPKNGDIFEFPSTDKTARIERPEKVVLKLKEETKQLPSIVSREQQNIYTQEEPTNYENREGLSEEELHNLSINNNKNLPSKEGLTKTDDQIPAGEQPAETTGEEQGSQQVAGTTTTQTEPSSTEQTPSDADTTPVIGLIPITGPTTDGPLVASVTQDPAEITEDVTTKEPPTSTETEQDPVKPTTPGVIKGGTDGEIGFFQPGDVATTSGLGGGSSISGPEIFPTGKEKDPLYSERPAVMSVYGPDEVLTTPISAQSCVPISLTPAAQFSSLSFDSVEFNTENPALNRFDFSIPFSSFSSLWSPSESLIIGVAVFREEQPGTLVRVTTARWNNLPVDIRQDSTFNFSVTHPRVFGQPVRARVMLWIGEEAICVDEIGLKKFSINLQPEPGKIYAIPNEEETKKGLSQRRGIKSELTR